MKLSGAQITGYVGNHFNRKICLLHILCSKKLGHARIPVNSINHHISTLGVRSKGRNIVLRIFEKIESLKSFARFVT